MSNKKELVLDMHGLTVYYQLEEELEKELVKALNDVSLQLRAGETLGLVGETGAGKTTAALSMLQLIPDPPGIIKSGSVMVCGHDMLNMTPIQLEKIRGKDVAMIFQDPMTSLNPVFTVGDQIAESLLLHENLTKDEAAQKARKMLETVGISGERAIEYPHQFSGGMKQRVVIAIALACSPKLLIADEPTTALDVTVQAQVMEMMKQLKTKYETAMIMITHDLGIVAEICDNVAVMYAGRIVEQGNLRDIFKETMHPYTEGLFNSLPNINDISAELKPIRGMMPDPTNLPPGCSFAPRCNYATKACFERLPELKEISDTHKVACIAYEQSDFCIKRRKGK